MIISTMALMSGVDELADNEHQLLADAARADEADHRRGADIDLEPKQDVAQVIRQTCGRTARRMI